MQLNIELMRAGRKLQSARQAEKEAFTAASVVAVEAANAGITEVAIAKALGVDRMTVRRWRGKL